MGHLPRRYTPPLMERTPLRRRLNAAAIHLAISCAIAALAGALVFGFWFPGVYRQLSGGSQLFLLVISVDVALGPLLTLAVFDVRKTRRHLAMDLSVIGLLQVAALVYGLFVVYHARPVGLVFEVDRFRIVAASQVAAEELPLAPSELQLSLTGPRLMGTRRPSPGAENNEALFSSLQRGVDLAQRPKFWQPWEQSRAAAVAASKPLSTLLARYPDQRAAVHEALSARGIVEDQARFLPLTGTRHGDWVMVLDARADPVHAFPVDGFF